ncbi:ruvB-like protein 1 [Dorcoceras hygrometricum]|uniref:RuvB-like protein 1 n=1 Tax=Dorcoceras hygrometricum TaxID=472368 RepID=A0A2Z7B3U2_9LAMI|nr:ruvB-like protein 1 [Dorcoceras hygrometricum]
MYSPHVQPKNLKFQNRSKRARYRIPARKLHGLPGTGPNQTLEEISRHDIAGASPERRPAGGRHQQKFAATGRDPRQARRTAARNSSPIAQPSRRKRRPASFTSSGHGAHHRVLRPSATEQRAARNVRPARTTSSRIIARQAHGAAAAEVHERPIFTCGGRCIAARTLRPMCATSAHHGWAAAGQQVAVCAAMRTQSRDGARRSGGRGARAADLHVRRAAHSSAHVAPDVVQPVRTKDGQRPANRWLFAQPCARNRAMVLGTKKTISSSYTCPAVGSRYYQSAVGLVFMESAVELAMETSRVDLVVRNQAEAKLNQLEHVEPAETTTTSCKLAEPVDYRSAVNKALQAEQDWKAIEEERQSKRQAFQQKDCRQTKKPNNNQQ